MATGKAGMGMALASFLRRKWLALGIFTLVLAGALGFAKGLPNLYQSTATVLVERPTTAGAPDDIDSRLQTIRQEVLSRTRLLELIGRFDLYPKLRRVASQEALVERMRRDVRIDASGSDQISGRGTIAFSLSYRGRDPRQVAQVANALASSYIEEDAATRGRETHGATSVLQTQIEEVKQRLSTQEQRIADFKKAHAGALPQQAEMSFMTIQRLSDQAQRLGESRTEALEKRAALLREAAEAESSGKNADADRLRLDKLNQELRELRTRFSERYPDVVSKKAEVESLTAIVAQKPQVDHSLPQLEQLNREIRGLQAEEARVRGEIAAHQRRAEGAPWREQEYQALSRDYSTTKDFYDTLLKRHEEAQLAEAHTGRPRGQRLRLLDPAIAAMEPIAPDRIRLAMFGLIAALGLAVVAVAGAERFDTSFHSAEELRAHTRVPILVRIPRFSADSAADRSRARWRAALLTAGLVVGTALAVNVSRLLARDNEGVVALFAPRGRS